MAAWNSRTPQNFNVKERKVNYEFDELHATVIKMWDVRRFIAHFLVGYIFFTLVAFAPMILGGLYFCLAASDF